MGTTQRREREKQQRRLDIVNTARQLFFSKGFRDTTIDDIARASELARGTIYLYFENKEEIYATVLEEGLEMLAQLLDHAQDPQADPLTNLLAAHDAFMEFHDRHAEYYNVLTLDKMQVVEALPETQQQRLAAKITAMAEKMAANLQDGMAQGYFRPLPALETAYLQMGMAMGFAQMLDKCAGNSGLFHDPAQTRQLIHDIVAMSVVQR